MALLLLPLPRLTLFGEEQANPAKMSPRQVSLFVRLLSFFHFNLTAANLSVGRAPLDVRTGRPRGRERERSCLLQHEDEPEGRRDCKEQ